MPSGNARPFYFAAMPPFQEVMKRINDQVRRGGVTLTRPQLRLAEAGSPDPTGIAKDFY